MHFETDKTFSFVKAKICALEQLLHRQERLMADREQDAFTCLQHWNHTTKPSYQGIYQQQEKISLAAVTQIVRYFLG